ncbi:MAG TPA: UDP-N-acetylmuramoyl-L-alanyl-D-glutamate--2,6-diaminopimelate ligase, partial [Steroidobacteraceae bacterium]|nr:UDP-N-acetylmuramoyl-L-alanyl-D-glutamate--2,6-diaminopimelate ligase [Steroidobacteraceae bacterium]
MPASLKLSEALRGADVLRRIGEDVAVTGVEYDSRRVAPGSLFVAMRGETTDGNRYIEQALARGAVAIVTDSAAAYDATADGPLEVALAEVPHGRRALATIAANVFGHPEQKIRLSGVTGTNGKTTTAYLLEQLLRTAGRSTALVGTIEYRIADEVRPAPHTTPESRDLLALLAEGVARGVTEGVMEVSSHALDQGRVWGVPYDVAIFTNLTQDHLDYHGTMGAYFAAKRKLFDGSQSRPPRVAILNAEDDTQAALAETAQAARSEIWSYGAARGDFHARDIAMRPNGMSFTLVSPRGEVRMDVALTGQVNVLNLLAASAAALARGLSLAQIAEAAPMLRAVPGRFEAVDGGQPFTVVVDYAHTDDALRNVLALARGLVSGAHGRVLTVFGCGGDRDRTKRPRMGRAAAEASEIIIVTSDNPRSENPRAIIDEILPGTTGAPATVEVEPDRAKAIALAMTKAHPNDIVVIAGKGHEKTQTIGNQVLPFDDVAVARQALAWLKGKS